MKVSSVVMAGLFLAAAASAEPSGGAGGSETGPAADPTEASRPAEGGQATGGEAAASTASRPATERQVCRRAEPLPGALTGRRVCRTVRGAQGGTNR